MRISTWMLVFTLLAACCSIASGLQEEPILAVPFQPGVTHINGLYRFSDRNFLLEGAERARDFGTQALFVYLDDAFRSEYPDSSNSAALWPKENPRSLVELVQTAPYQALLDLPFKTLVFTTYTFANGDPMQSKVPWSLQSEQSEENEIYELARFLFSKYRDSGRIFIIKNHETDWHTSADPDLGTDATAKEIETLKSWFSARQRGVARARREADLASDRRSVGVYHAVEVNLVLDVARENRRRVLNTVVPAVKADLVSYSAHEAVLEGSDKASTARAIVEALSTIDRWAPDPLDLGKRRIFIAEFGLYENEHAKDDPSWRTEAVLETAEEFGLPYAFHWQLFDNEAEDAQGVELTRVAAGVDDPDRPKNENCTGLWLVRPDGSLSSVVPVLQRYWARLLVRVGDPETVLEPGSFGLRDFPDGHMGVMKRDGRYEFFIGAFPPDQGPEDPPRTFTFRLISDDLNVGSLRPDPVDERGCAMPVLEPGKPGSYNDHIAGNGSVYHDPKTGKTYFWYEAMRSISPAAAEEKERVHGQAFYPAYGRIGLAIWNDDRQRFDDMGYVLQPNLTFETFEADARFGYADTFPPAVVRDGEFLYMYYSDYRNEPPPKPGEEPDLAVARLRISELDQNPQPWLKLSGGKFVGEAMGGPFTPLILDTTFPAVSFNTCLQKWIMVHKGPGGDHILYWRMSNDGLAWSDRVELARYPSEKDWSLGPTIIGTGDDPTRSGKKFWVYYEFAPSSRTTKDLGWLARQSVELRER